MDLFEYAGRDFVAIIDAYSNYLIALKISNKISGHIISVISSVFDKVGYPTIIKCDNSPFGSAEFDRFAAETNIQFKFSSPRYPQSNGLAEKGVAIAKNILKRCVEENKVDQFQYRILEYNATPIASMALTPSELFFGRLIKTKLPVSESTLVRNNLKENEIQEKIKTKRETQKYYYDRHTKSLPTLSAGDLVVFKKDGKEWNYGTVVRNVNDRSYIVRDSFNNHFRRNRRFLAKTKNEEFSASELIFEDNVKSKFNSESMKNINIVPPRKQKSSVQPNQTCEVNEAETPRAVELDESVSLKDDESAGRDASEAEQEEGHVVEPDTDATELYRTRGGRAVIPPRRYGWD